MSEGPEWVGCGLVLDSAGLGPRASLSVAVVQNGPHATLRTLGARTNNHALRLSRRKIGGFNQPTTRVLFRERRQSRWRIMRGGSHTKLCARGTR